MKGIKTISLKSQILGDTVTFLKNENMECLVTQDGMVELISQLVYYKEEGKALYPEIYIFDDIALVEKVIPTSQFFPIGSGVKTKETMLKALKKCAPLTEGGWAIYILRKSDSFDFGVFRNGTPIHSISISEALIEGGSEDLKAILIHQVAEKIIEVKGVKSDSLLISFGSQDDLKNPPTENISKFVDIIVSEVKNGLKEPTKNFYNKLFLEVLQKGHGTLACVIENKKKLPLRLKDGITLTEKINIPKLIEDLTDKGDLRSNSILEGKFSLIVGMMQSDGITVLTNKGEIAAYNVFIKHPEKITKTTTTGGARSRTYLTLCDLIGNGIKSAYIQSQDGKIEFN